MFILYSVYVSLEVDVYYEPKQTVRIKIIIYSIYLFILYWFIFIYLFFKFYFIFKLYIIVLVLPNYFILVYSGSDGKASVCNAGDPGSIPGLGRSPGEGNGNPLQYSCLENPMMTLIVILDT